MSGILGGGLGVGKVVVVIVEVFVGCVGKGGVKGCFD